jgi:hypothetical protein
MKGFTVQNGNEIRLEIEGERWFQGDSVKMRLDAKKEAHLFLGLAVGTEKKIKAKSEDAFQILESSEMNALSLSKEFQLPVDARITDKSGSLYAIYGIGNPPATLASLRLQVDPHPHIRDLVEVLTHHYRFTAKTFVMGKKQEVEIKLEPSGAKEWASLESLTLLARLDGSKLHLKFQFQRKEINAMKTALTAQSVTRTLEKAFGLNEIIHDFNQRLNKEKMILAMDALIEEYRSQNGILG